MFGPGDESLVAGARQDDAADRRIIARILEGLAQVRPGRRVQRIEDLRAIDGDVGDAALERVEDVLRAPGPPLGKPLSHLLLK